MRRFLPVFYAVCLIVLSACGCSKRDKPAIDPVTPLTTLDDKAGVYEAQLSEALDLQGFVHDRCDGLLFRTLLAVARGVEDRELILSAREPSGKWHRHPLKDCYIDDRDNGSKSTISNDMLLGLAWWAWEFKAADVVKGVIDYGKAHNWNMGDGDPFRTIMRPSLIITYYDIARKLGVDAGTPLFPLLEQERWGGEVSTMNYGTVLQLNLYTDEVSLQTGYEAHLQVLHTLLRAHVLGAASVVDLDVLKSQAERQPNNALFQAAYHLYADGDQSEALKALENEAWFPATRLPTAADRCPEYLFQRDEVEWAGCSPDGKRPHSATDFRFALKVAQNKLRK